MLAPGGIQSALIGNMVFSIQHLDADVEMIMRDDMADLVRHRLDDRIEIELARQKPGNPQIAVEQRVTRRIEHGRTSSSPSAVN
ncbi:hypothetical protein D3C80_1031070 [compost metagenome]